MSKVVKVELNNDTRRVTLQDFKVENLTNHIRGLYSLPSESVLKLKFLDEDQDWITISLDEELAEAVDSSTIQSPLRITVEVLSSPTTTTTTETTSSSNSQEVTKKPSFMLVDEVEENKQQKQEQLEQQEQQNQMEVEDKKRQQKQKEQALQLEQNEFKPVDKKIKIEEDETKVKEKEDAFIPKNLQDVQPQQVSSVEYLTNEFHYHRLIVQTAVQAAFSHLRKTYQENGEPRLHEMMDRMNERKVIIFEAVTSTLNEWRNDMNNNLPPPNEIADRVSQALREVGSFATPFIENVRTSIFNILTALFQKNPLSITNDDVERMSNIAAQQPDLEMETVMTQLNDDSATIKNPDGEVHVPSNLSDEDFIYVENYRMDDPSSKERQLAASKASEIVWEEPEEERKAVKEQEQQQEQPSTTTTTTTNTEQIEESLSDSLASQADFPYFNQLWQLVEMGFKESDAKSVLIQHNGNLEASLNELLRTA